MNYGKGFRNNLNNPIIMASFYHNCFVFLVPFHRGDGTGGTLGTRCLIMPMLLFHLFRLFRTGGGTEQNKVDVFADGYVCSAAAIGEIGQSQFAPLKLRSLALVPSSGALPRPFELHLWQLHCKTLPSAPGAPVRDLRPFRAPASPVLMRGVSEGRNDVPVRRSVPESGQPAAGLSPPGAAGAFPPNKGKAVARLLPAPRSGCLPQPFPSHTRSRQETRPGIPPGPPRGTQSPGLRRTPLHRKR